MNTFISTVEVSKWVTAKIKKVNAITDGGVYTVGKWIASGKMTTL